MTKIHFLAILLRKYSNPVSREIFDRFHYISCPVKCGYKTQNYLSRPIRRENVTKDLFRQHCYRNLATLLIIQFSKCVHWIPRLKKHGYRARNYVSRRIRRKIMMKIVISQSKFPLKSHFCDVNLKNRFLGSKNLFFTKTHKRTSCWDWMEHLKSILQNWYSYQSLY